MCKGDKCMLMMEYIYIDISEESMINVVVEQTLTTVCTYQHQFFPSFSPFFFLCCYNSFKKPHLVIGIVGFVVIRLCNNHL